MSASRPARPLVSVCLPTYRRPRQVVRALDSVLAAVERGGVAARVEVLVADDASADDTAALLAAHPGAGRAFRHVSRLQNLGMSHNLLAMLRDEAVGDYVLILSDDDTLVPEGLAVLVRELEATAALAPGVLWTPRPSYLEDGTLHCVECASFDEARTLGPSPRVAGRHMHGAFILSGLVLRREAIDFALWEQLADNAFFPILIAGDLMTRRPSRYLAQALVRHTVFNQTHWWRWGPTELDIEARLFSDFQAAYAELGRRLRPRAALQFHAASVAARAWSAANYARRPGGLVEIARARGPRAAGRLLVAGGLPGWSAWPLLAFGLLAGKRPRDAGKSGP